MKTSIRTDSVINEVLRKVEDRNILQAIKRRRANWVHHIFRTNCS